eukprot:2944354-Rhodomonas_salina.2
MNPPPIPTALFAARPIGIHPVNFSVTDPPTRTPPKNPSPTPSATPWTAFLSPCPTSAAPDLTARVVPHRRRTTTLRTSCLATSCKPRSTQLSSSSAASCSSLSPCCFRFWSASSVVV